MTLAANFRVNKAQNRAGRILVVEDDTTTRELLAALLGDEYEVIAAADGQQALEHIQHEAVDLVLLDIMMRGINGFDVLKALRSDETTVDLPVILISAVSDPDTVVRGLEAGANDYVPKPIELSVLQARVKTQLKLKLLTDEHKKYIEELERAEQLRLQFSRIASHDLKNPLHNVRIATTLLKDEMSDNPRVEQILKMLDLTADNMQHVIEAFLDVVAIQSNTIAMNLEPLALSDVVVNVVTQYEIAAEEKEITLKMGSLDGYVREDNARMVQVVGNLVSNALKYSPLGSTVTIWTETHHDRWRLCVQDEGPGIPQAERSQLFTEFAKLSTRPTADESRTGLGLWIVKHLMQKQGGKVGALFPDDGGSIFWLELPVVNVKTTATVTEESA